MSVPPGLSLGPISVLSLENNDKEIFYRAKFNSAAYYMEVPGKISFPDPPRPPTPGPPRPPPIPPRPPVPTPPPSPHSSVEKEWLQRLVAENISILAVRMMNVWFAAREPVSFPHPPRPPLENFYYLAGGYQIESIIANWCIPYQTRTDPPPA